MGALHLSTRSARGRGDQDRAPGPGRLVPRRRLRPGASPGAHANVLSVPEYWKEIGHRQHERWAWPGHIPAAVDRRRFDRPSKPTRSNRGRLVTQAAGIRHHRVSVPAGRAGPVVLAPPFARAGPRKFLSDRHTRSPPLCHPEPESCPDEGRRGAAGERRPRRAAATLHGEWHELHRPQGPNRSSGRSR